MPGGIHRGVPTAPGSFFQKKKYSRIFFPPFLKECAHRGGDTPVDAPRLGLPEMSFLRKKNEKESEEEVL